MLIYNVESEGGKLYEQKLGFNIAFRQFLIELLD
jgi:hypothetical protein